MRTIKFRAWDKKKKEMNYTDKASLHQGRAVKFNLMMPWRDNIFVDEWELMQFVGLKDKKGKEIYEGDLLRIKFIANPDNKIKEWRYKVDAIYKVTISEFSLCVSIVKLYKPDSLITHMYFRDEDFRNEGDGILKIDSKYESGEQVRPVCNVEVIGNIYENKELL